MLDEAGNRKELAGRKGRKSLRLYGAVVLENPAVDEPPRALPRFKIGQQSLQKCDFQASVEAQVEDQLPSRAPSFFFVDIQQNQIEAFTKLVSGFPTAADFNATPMLRGRIVRLNGVPVADAKIATESRWAVDGDRVTNAGHAARGKAQNTNSRPYAEQL